MKFVFVGLIVLAGFGAPARAESDAAFTRRYQAGVDAFRLGKYDEARARLRAARTMRPSLPGPHRFLAAVAAAKSEWEDCIASAREAIAANPQSTEIVATRKLHDDCRSELGRPGFAGPFADGGAIAVTANVVGASVTIGGLRYGATPVAPRAMVLGEVVVAAEKTGWLPGRATARVLPGIVTDVYVLLREAPVKR